jgi:hypothetical protein
MTIREKRTDILSCVHHLNDAELDKLYRMMEETFPEKVYKPTQPSKKRKAGTMKGMLKYMADDFKAPLEDFKDYM